MNLVLGTAQFGTNYGIANTSGVVNTKEVAKILEVAIAGGIRAIDTAMNYGNAENRLGEIGVSDFSIITKLPKIPNNDTKVEFWVNEQVNNSLERLGVSKLHGLLLHSPQDLAGTKGSQLLQALRKICKSGLVEQTGISIYSPSELVGVDTKKEFGLVQAPMNVFDRRIVESGALEYLQRAGVEVHIRSAFLQGLLLMETSTIPQKLKRFRPLIERWHEWCSSQSLLPLQACLAHVKSTAKGSKIVVGCDNAKQLQGIIEAAKTKSIEAPSYLLSGDIELINPTQWGKI